jgi:hypothetical protein
MFKGCNTTTNGNTITILYEIGVSRRCESTDIISTVNAYENVMIPLIRKWYAIQSSVYCRGIM